MTHRDLYWFHAVTLLNGEKTAGEVDLDGATGKHYLLPPDLKGKRVLDFGTFDGYWAIEAQRRGATVLAVDRHVLPTAKMALGERNIPYLGGPEFNLEQPFSPAVLEQIGQHDVVLFYGILYHLKNPVIGLLNAARCCREGGLVIVESAVNQGRVKHLPADLPVLWLIDGGYEENVTHDPTNVVMPNPAGVVQLCRMAGLKPTAQTASPPPYFLRFTVVCEK